MKIPKAINDELTRSEVDFIEAMLRLADINGIDRNDFMNTVAMSFSAACTLYDFNTYVLEEDNNA